MMIKKIKPQTYQGFLRAAAWRLVFPATVLEQAPTLSVRATQAGMLIGTAPYMSPEQAKGKQADKRSDIWSFGVVVYELLTGRTAFTRASVVETLAAVINEEPDWTTVPPQARPLLELR